MAHPHDFGGTWTERKLRALGEYLRAYNKALKNQPFHRIYIDAFAGTGYRTSRAERLELLDVPAVDELAAGSARVALEVDPPFHEYVFIENDPLRFGELRDGLTNGFRAKRSVMKFLQEDANLAIQQLCRGTDWRNTRAVAFLDPYGMQVDWATVEAIARTQAIDLWYLFPAGMAIHRSTPRDGKFPAGWRATLDRCLGQGWREAFYSQSVNKDLFGERTVTEKTVAIPEIETFFLDRLRTIFAGVAPNGLHLENSQGYPMYLLCFACGNPSPGATDLALRLAKAVLEKEERSR